MSQVFVGNPGEAIACNQVHSSLRPCLEYLHGKGGSPPAACCKCNGLNILSKMINQSKRQEKQTFCKCIKTAASRAKFKANKSGQLPGKCGVKIAVPISPTIDCRK
ncbi:unnamed protein product [Fraxinus pennsylvanica]|uniref:Bifunctional inhibitor/plant lipid transfer protein/seed storage helical domain-containing protein n=1 Tax=Fraxinus pennsylvanica TaxID=56036 RepID=A0AAD2DP78_9LAMI|nr:unnamed protein product [Fraxinus pennsylvanica]